MASKPKASTTKSKPTTVKYSSSVAEQQSDLNKKGAGLKVDGLLGPKTQAAINKYATPISTSKGASSASGKATPTGTISAKQKTSTFANPLSGGFFKNVLGGVKTVAGGFKDAINTVATKAGSTLAANALNAQSKSALPESYGETSNRTGDDLKQFNDPSYFNPYKTNPLNPIIGGGNIVNAEEGYGANASADMFSGDASGSQANKSGQFMEEPPSPNNPTGKSGGSSTPTPALDTPVSEEPISEPTPDEPLTQNMGAGNVSNPYAGLGIKFDDLNMGLNGSSVNDKTAWMSKGSKGEFQTAQTINYANNAAKMFNTPQEATAYFSSPEGQQKVQAYVSMGGKIQDIINKVKPVTNGITPAQTTAEYLAGGPASLNEERKLMNEAIASELNFTQQMKDVYIGNDAVRGIAEQQKLDNEARIEYYDKMEAKMEKSLKDKARLAIDKAEAEFEKADAETEIARLNAKSNLTEFLAKIGALRTDGNALTGLEKLEQAYQAQRQGLRQNFLFAKREIQNDMEDKIFNIESDYEEKKFKLGQDLSKTEREVAMDVAKLDYDLQKTLNSYKLKWSDSIKTEKEKAAKKSADLSSDYYEQFFTTTGANTFAGLPAAYKESWKANAPSWITPEYKGQITGEQVAKSFNQYNVDQGNIDAPAQPSQYMLNGKILQLQPDGTYQ